MKRPSRCGGGRASLERSGLRKSRCRHGQPGRRGDAKGHTEVGASARRDPGGFNRGSGMSSQKPLLLPWLIKQIDSGQYPGLEWTNKEHSEFRIPWKHGLRQDRQPDDSLIFKAWAIASGRYKEHIDKADPTVWKRNFRCALNRKTHFKVVKDLSNDSVDPHKVYHVCQSEESRQSSQESCKDELQESPQENFPGAGAACFPPTSENLTLGYDFFPNDFKGYEDILEHDLEEMSISNQQNKVTDFRVSVYFRGVLAAQFSTVGGLGFQLLFDEVPNAPGTENLTQLRIPGTEKMSDAEQARYTGRILRKLGQGLAVKIQDKSILASRLGDSHIFWSLSKFDSSCHPQEVSKHGYTEVYNFGRFVRELLDFIESRGGSPQYSLWFCLGEAWPDPNKRPWEKKLIMIEVIPICFEILKNTAVAGGASSLQGENIELQLSDNPSLRSLLESMETN
ncbi:IRF3 factor, partial [Polypterus senegalus]